MSCSSALKTPPDLPILCTPGYHKDDLNEKNKITLRCGDDKELEQRVSWAKSMSSKQA